MTAPAIARPSPGDSLTYLTTEQLSERIHYDPRTIRTRLNDSVLVEGVHYIRPFGGRKILYIWEHIERDMQVASRNASGERAKEKKEKAADKWSPVEDKHLREGWGQHTAQELARQLGRSKGAVHRRCAKLGLKAPDAWREAELQIIREHYVDEGPAALELRLGRTAKAIQVQARRMGLLRRPKHAVWTEREDAILRRFVGELPLSRIHSEFFAARSGEEMGTEFVRTYPAVAQRCGALGISLPRREAALQRRPRT